MIVPKKIRDKWSKLKDAGDIAKIADDAKVSGNTVSTAMAGKYCSQELFLVITDFYKKREELINNAA